MRLLVYVPRSRELKASIASIDALTYGGDVAIWHDWTGNAPDEHRYDVITAKAERARRRALDEDADALVIIEDDQVVPAAALQMLASRAVLGDVIYGLSVWRHDPTVWTAASEIDEQRIKMITKVSPPGIFHKLWGGVHPFPGVHMGCTLMTRRALEAVTFQRRGPNCYDYYAAVDWQAQGIRQMTDFGLHVGHITDNGIAYPSLDPGNHRLVEEMLHENSHHTRAG